MKGWFDRKAKVRQFNPGDKVLVFLPIPGASLGARYSGPYVVKGQVGDRDYCRGFQGRTQLQAVVVKGF